MTKEELVETLEALVQEIEEDGSTYMGSDAFAYASLLNDVRRNIEYGDHKIIVKSERVY